MNDPPLFHSFLAPWFIFNLSSFLSYFVPCPQLQLQLTSNHSTTNDSWNWLTHSRFIKKKGNCAIVKDIYKEIHWNVLIVYDVGHNTSQYLELNVLLHFFHNAWSAAISPQQKGESLYNGQESDLKNSLKTAANE